MCPWIPLLNRFDDILQKAVENYGLDDEYPKPIPVNLDEERLLISILDFTAFLMDKCSNRGIYSSVKSVACMLNSISPSIVASALKVCVKIAQRFAQSRTGRSNVTAIDPDKIFNLATFLPLSPWEQPGKSDINLYDFIDPNYQWSENASAFSLQYYIRSQPHHQPPTTPSKGGNSDQSAQSQEGLTTLYISSNEVQELPAQDLLAKIFSILPKESWFSALNKARVAKACVNSEQGLLLRKELCKIQLLAIGFAACTFGEPTVENKILNRTPNILRQISDLVSPEFANVPIKLRVLALETLDNMCNQVNKVSEILTALSANVNHGTLMSVIRNTINDLKANVDIDEDFTCSLFMVILQLAQASNAGTILVTAGLIPLVLEIVQLDTPYVRTLSNAIELIDHIVMDIPSTFQAFIQANGIEILLKTIQKEIDYDLSPDQEEAPPDYCLADYNLSYYRSQWVRALLGFVSNILNNNRTSERIHSLVDSPLMHVSQKIVRNPGTFGYRIVSLNLQILSSMLEHEPSSYSIMHEAKLIDTAVEVIPGLLDISNNYYSPVARFISSLCHSEGGLQLVQDQELLSMYFSKLTKNIVQNGSLKSLGSTFDLLVSDHPDLRPTMIKEVLKLLITLPQAIEPVSNNSRFFAETENVTARSDAIIDPSSDIMNVVSNVVGFFEGFLRNHLTRVEFIKQLGVTYLLDLFQIPNLPYDFAYSHAAFSLGSILRSLFDLDICSDYIQETMIHKIAMTLDSVESSISGVPYDAQIVRDESSLDPILRSLSQLNSFLYAFYQIVFVNPGTGYRIMFILDKLVSGTALDGDSSRDIVSRLGAVQRWCIWQEARSLDGLSGLFIEATKPLSIAGVSRNYRSLYETDEFKKVKEAEEQLEDSPSLFFVGVKVFRFLAHANSMLSSKIFSEFAAVCTNERAMSSRKKNGLKMAELIARVLVNHLNYMPLQEISADGFREAKYHTTVSVLVAIQKIMFRPWNNTLSCYLGVFVCFKQNQGIQMLMALLKSLWDLPIESGATDAGSSLLVGSQKVILVLLTFFVSHKSILENTRVVSALTSREDRGSRSYFAPSQFFVECRIIVLDSLKDLWESDTLENKHHSVSQIVVDVMSKLLNYSGEDSGLNGRADKESLPRELSWKYVTPSEDKVQTITELGFQEADVRSALTKANDDVGDAAEILLRAEPDSNSDILSNISNDNFPLPLGHAPIGPDGSKLVTAADLNQLRDNVKKTLIDRAINLLRSHTEIVHSISSLIIKAFSLPLLSGSRSERQKESLASAHKEVVSTILQVVSSLDYQDSNNSKAIAAISHLLGLVVQDSVFFGNCFEDLVESIELFVSLLELPNAHEAEWYASVLLIVERLLSNLDVPVPEKRVFESSVPEVVRSMMPTIDSQTEQKIFHILVKPVEFKDELSALATARLMVHFSKRPKRAEALMSSGIVAHLLRSLKQFAGCSNYDKLQTAIFIILRQTVETYDMIRETMVNEVKAWFSTSRVADASVFVKANYQLVARDPEIFIEVVGELCTFHDSSLSSSNICLKQYAERRIKKARTNEERVRKDLERIKSEKNQTEEPEKLEPAAEREEEVNAPSTGKEDTPMEDVSHMGGDGTSTGGSKIPCVDKPSGVVKLLLSELFSLKKDDLFTVPERSEESLQAAIASKEKMEFKPSEHPNYMYFCAILHALIELLSSYNKCKLEFLNFSKKDIANPSIGSYGSSASSLGSTPSTPLKPRSFALNMFLHELLPTGVLSESGHVVYQEWYTVSSLASACLMNLLTATTEKGKKSKYSVEVQNDPTLAFIRKFSLDAFARVLKEIHLTNESVDWRYSMLANLSELCHRLLASRNGFSSIGANSDHVGDGAAIAKIMYDKKFATIFTTNIGQLDLNFPHAKKVVKLGLRFLNKLSMLALDISEELENENREDEAEEDILSDSDDYNREDTPDLFRNSTLGMFEVGENMYDNEEDLEEDEDSELQEDEEEIEYDGHDEALSDVDDDGSEDSMQDDSIQYNDGDDDEGDSDEGSEDDDEMNVSKLELKFC